MKRLCVDVRLWRASGIGTFLRNLLIRLRPHFSLTLLCFFKDQEEITSLGFQNLIFMKAPLYSFREQVELSRIIPSCDLFWAPHFNVPLLPIRAKKRLTTIHDIYHLDHAHQFSLPARLYAQLMYRSALRLSDLVTTDSLFSKERIEKTLRPSRSPVVVPLGVDASFQPCHEEEKRRVKERYGLPDRFLFSISNFKPHKNLQRLLEATCHFKDYALVLAGKKIEAEGVHSIAHVEDRDLPAFYSLATLLIFPSLYEGFGLPPLEAMACGCPAVVSKIASLPEVCGEAAEYVDPFSSQSIRKGIERVLFSEQRQKILQKKGLEWASQMKWERSAKRYLELIG